MSTEIQNILSQCKRLSVDEQLSVIQALAENLKNQVSQATHQRDVAANSDRPETTQETYQPKNAKDYINHIR